MVSQMISPDVTGATLPGSDSAQITLTPSCFASSKSTPHGFGDKLLRFAAPHRQKRLQAKKHPAFESCYVKKLFYSVKATYPERI
jgi:hypothetical protein